MPNISDEGREKDVKRWQEQRAVWDREYSKPDPMWKGPPKSDVPMTVRGRVLELGCGNGKTAAALVKAGEEVMAIDFSRKGLEACQRAVASSNLNLMQADLRWLPFTDASFDHVVAFHVLSHLDQAGRERAVEEIRRVLRPGGGLLVRAFSRQDMRCGKGAEIEPGTFVKGNGIPCHFFTADELDSLLSGFKKLLLEEKTAAKRYDGQDLIRAELVGAYQSF